MIKARRKILIQSTEGNFIFSVMFFFSISVVGKSRNEICAAMLYQSKLNGKVQAWENITTYKLCDIDGRKRTRVICSAKLCLYMWCLIIRSLLERGELKWKQL